MWRENNQSNQPSLTLFFAILYPANHLMMAFRQAIGQHTTFLPLLSRRTITVRHFASLTTGYNAQPNVLHRRRNEMWICKRVQRHIPTYSTNFHLGIRRLSNTSFPSETKQDLKSSTPSSSTVAPAARSPETKSNDNAGQILEDVSRYNDKGKRHADLAEV